MKSTLLLLLTFLLIGCANSDAEQAESNTQTEVIVSVDEWDVPFDDTRSRDPYVAPDGTVFFAGQRAHYVGHFNPETEEFRELPLEDGTGPHTVTVADDGTVWYAGNRAQHIGKMDPETGEIPNT